MRHSLQIIIMFSLIAPSTMIYAGEKPSIDLTDTTRTTLNQEYVDAIVERMHSMHLAVGEESGRFMDTPAIHHHYNIISNEEMRQDAIAAGLQSPYPFEREIEIQSLFIIKLGYPLGEEKQLKRSPEVGVDLDLPIPEIRH